MRRRRIPWAFGVALTLSWAALAFEDIPWLLERTSAEVRSSLFGVRRSQPFMGGQGVTDSLAAWRVGTRRRLELPTGETVVVAVNDACPDMGGGGWARGRVEGDAGSEVLLSEVDGTLAGTVRRGSGRMFVIEPRGGGRYLIRDLESASAPRCGNPGGEGLVVPEPGRNPSKSTLAMTEEAGTNVLDVVFFYTATAEAGAGGAAGMRALIALAVHEANDAFGRSGARVSLRTVGVRPVPYVESGDAATDLARLSGPGGGVGIEGVVGVRDELGADLVCLVIESESTQTLAGMAHQLRDTNRASIERGFLVCLRPYLIGNYTLPHEVGHALGCDHDRDHAGGGLHAWSFGNRITVEGEVYRTVMAYRPGRQFPHFSNPLVSYRGVPTGTGGAAGADNVRTLNFTAPLVATAREPASRVGFDAPAVVVSESAGGLSLTLRRAGRLAAGSVWVRAVEGSALAEVDFDTLNLRLEFGEGVEMGEVRLKVRDNGDVDGPRRLAIGLEEPSEGLALGPVAVVDVTILDDEIEGTALVDGSFRPQPGADHLVAALAVDGSGRVLAGGGFTTFNGDVRWRLARVLPEGAVDAGFAPQVKYGVNSVAVLADGRVAVAGDFNTVNAAVRNRVAVLREDGSLDPAFTFEPGADRRVNVVAAAAPSGFWIGGAFTSVQGVPALCVARLRPGGGLETTFDSRNGPDDEVLALHDDPRGGVLVGGRFARVAGVARGRVARLDERGRLDTAFAAGAGADGVVYAMSTDGEGRVLIGGDFQRFEGSPVGRVVRLSPGGAWDTGFDPGGGPNGPVRTVLARPDGSVWLGGDFTVVAGVPRRRVARLLDDGSLDVGFDPGVGLNDRVLALAEGRQGVLYVGGVFTAVNGVSRGGIAALLTTAPPAPVLTRATWTEAGLDWEAMAWPRQWYDVERSADLVNWGSVVTVKAGAEGVMSGAVGAGEEAVGFVRLRRRLE